MAASKGKVAHAVKVRRVASYLALERDHEKVAAFCAHSFGSSPAECKRLINDARASLALAADVDVREEVGKRKEQLEDLQARAREAGDLRVELSAIQELAKLLDLYQQSQAVDAENSAEGIAASIARKHLEGLGVTPAGLPLEELARLVAAAYMRLSCERSEIG